MAPRANSKKAPAAPTTRKRAAPARKTPPARAKPAAEPVVVPVVEVEAESAVLAVGDLRAVIDGFGPQVGELRSQLEALRGDLEQTRKELEETRRQARAAPDEWKRAQGEATGLHEQLKATDRDARKHAEELAAQLRAARDESKALARDLAAAREQLAFLAGEARARRDEVAGPSAEPAMPEAGGRNRLGVTVEPGLVIAEVRADSPAAAELAPGDVIDGVNGLPVRTGVELREAVHAVPGDADVTFRIRRNGLAQDVKARREVPSPDDDAAEGRDWLGLTVEPGVVVDEVLTGSPAAAAGLQPGDVITRVNDEPVAGGEQLRAVIQPLLPRTEVCLRVTHAGRPDDVILRLDDPAIGSSG